jgi:heptaprenyl diphosphate synthase
MQKKQGSAKRLALLSLFSALSLIMFLIESLFPSIMIPGAKIGLGNIFVLLALITLGPWQAYTVAIVKSVLGSFISGNLNTLLFSLSASLVSVSVAVILFYVLKARLSILAVSVVSAVAHNITQNAVYALVTDSSLVFSYLPYLSLLGIISGAVVGITVVILLRVMPDKFWQMADF